MTNMNKIILKESRLQISNSFPGTFSVFEASCYHYWSRNNLGVPRLQKTGENQKKILQMRRKNLKNKVMQVYST